MCKSAMTRSIILCSSSRLFHLKPYNTSQSLPSNRGVSNLGIISTCNKKNQIDFVGYLSNSQQGLPRNEKNKRNFAVHNSVQPGVPPPSDSWNGWILGVVITIVFPFLTNKWGQLLRLKNQVDEVVETVEQMADVVEEVAEQVEKVAEEALDDLPAGKLKNVVSFVENVAERTADNAELLGDLIDKVQELEENVESIVELSSVPDKEKEPHKEASDEPNEPVKEPKVDQDHM